MDQLPPAGPSGASRSFAWLAVLALILALWGVFHLIGSSGGGLVESRTENGQAMVALERDRSGHFLANGLVNGQDVAFLVDTGATDVALSERKARELGLEFGPRMTVMTAAGPAVAWRTRLESVRIGSLELSNVRASITPGLGDRALLGMSFLQYFDWRQEQERLVIETKN